MLEANKNKNFDDDIVMETDGVIAEITSENFVDCIGGQLEMIITNNVKNQEVNKEKRMNERGFNTSSSLFAIDCLFLY